MTAAPRLIVFGATGGTGIAIMRACVARRQPLTVFARDPGRLGTLDRSVRLIEGEVFDAAAVAAAIVGHDAVISTLGTRPWRHTDVCSVGTRHIVAGMTAAGARRLVVLSSIGVGTSRDHSGPATKIAAATVLRLALADKTVMEDELRRTDLDWVIVRPTMLTNGKRHGVRAADDDSIRGGTIARVDVADFVLAQLTSDAWLRQAPLVTGA